MEAGAAPSAPATAPSDLLDLTQLFQQLTIDQAASHRAKPQLGTRQRTMPVIVPAADMHAMSRRTNVAAGQLPVAPLTPSSIHQPEPQEGHTRSKASLMALSKAAAALVRSTIGTASTPGGQEHDALHHASLQSMMLKRDGLAGSWALAHEAATLWAGSGRPAAAATPAPATPISACGLSCSRPFADPVMTPEQSTPSSSSPSLQSSAASAEVAGSSGGRGVSAPWRLTAPWASETNVCIPRLTPGPLPWQPGPDPRPSADGHRDTWQLATPVGDPYADAALCHQLEVLLSDKARLAEENWRLKSENQSLHDLLLLQQDMLQPPDEEDDEDDLQDGGFVQDWGRDKQGLLPGMGGAAGVATSGCHTPVSVLMMPTCLSCPR